MKNFVPAELEDILRRMHTHEEKQNAEAIIGIIDLAIERAVVRAVEQTLSHMPQVMVELLKFGANYSMVKQEFFEKHPELKARPEVLRRIPEYQTAHPGMAHDKLLELIAMDAKAESIAPANVIGYEPTGPKPTQTEVSTILKGLKS